ncbi:MAG: TIGR03936 family radical SAM-associated protein, partial [Nitrospirota bacterium]
VSASPFVPKPFTPMQWYGQDEMEKIKAKLSYLRRRLSNKRLTFRSHNTDTSLLEAVFSRGDSGLSVLIEKAWALGCRLDAWTEAFDFSKWLKAAEICGIDLRTYAMRKFDKESRLPWDNILDSGIREDFLIRESQKVHSGEITKDCNTLCSGCGLDCKAAVSSQQPAVKPLAPCPVPLAPKKILSIDPRVSLRVQFSKTGVMRYLSHRELMTTITRALRRADIPLVYSQGFHPSPKVSFGPPLNVGLSGLREYLDMEVRPDCLKLDLENTINRHLPEGIKIQGVNLLPEGAASLNSFISRYEYEIISANANLMEDFLRMENFVYTRESNSNSLRKGSKVPVKISVNLREMVEDACLTDNETVRLIAVDRGENKVRVNELISAIFRVSPETAVTTRLCMSGWRDKWVDPLYYSEFITNHEHEELVHEQRAGACSVSPLATTYQG